MKPEITIITPSYNQGVYISRAIESILKQDLGRRLEYIILDSLSTDNTNKVIMKKREEIKKSGIVFKYIRAKDNGQSDALNKGFKIAQGEILGWLNSDDEYYPDVLKDVLSYFGENTDMNWAYGGWSYVDNNGKVYKTVEPKKFCKSTLLSYDNIGQPACFFSKALLERVGYLNERLEYTMDYDLWLRFLQLSEPGIINKKIAKLRCYKGTKSSNGSVKQFLSVYNLNSKYSKTISFLKVKQAFYTLAGIILGLLHLDIANRVGRKVKIPFLDTL